MILSPNEAKSKVCIHIRRITESGMCVAEQCMYWQIHYASKQEDIEAQKLNKKKIEQKISEIKRKRIELWEKSHSVSELELFDINNPFPENVASSEKHPSGKGYCRLCK